MAGVLFVVCIPTCKHEKKLRKIDAGNGSGGGGGGVKPDIPNKVFNFNHVKANSSDNLLNVKLNKNAKNKAVDDGEAGNADELSALLKSRSELVYIDVDSVPDLSGAKPLKNDVKGNVGEADWGTTAAAASIDVNLNRTPTLLDLPQQDEDPLMEKILDELLKQLKIDNAVWCAGKSDNFYQVFFSAGSEVCEEALAGLQEWGIGIILNSIVSVIPCSLYYDGIQQATSEEDVSEERNTKKEVPYVSAWDKFVASVGARLTVAQVVERVKCDACLTFDFLVLLLIAGVVATLGLIENSTVILVASMLISPLMGPIMAGTFGFVIEDKRLRRMGILNELVGLSLCLLVGFGMGLAVGMTDDYWGDGSLPTEEMLSRGKIRSLWVGALIALPSGAAVAIALLGDKTGSLVGVAISASILPPAVNAGLLWALALINSITGEATGPDSLALQSNATAPVPVEPSFVYSEDKSVELAILGVVSLCLTLVNILCIFLMGILVLKIKEVAPRTSGKQSQFWRHDIKIARDYNKTLNKEDGLLFQKQLADELAGLTEADLSSHHISPERMRNISHRLLPHRNQLTWSPSVRNSSSPENRLSLQELEDLYMDLTGTKRAVSPVRRSSSLKPPADQGTLPPWYRHVSPPTGLPTILEASSPFEAGVPKRRMTYAAHDVVPVWPYQPPNRKRFVVSPVEEEEPTQ